MDDALEAITMEDLYDDQRELAESNWITVFQRTDIHLRR